MTNSLNLNPLTRFQFWLHYATNYYRFRDSAGFYGPEKIEGKRKKIEKIILAESETYGEGLETEVPTYQKGAKQLANEMLAENSFCKAKRTLSIL